MEIYVIKEGDTVYGIAKELGVSVERLIRDNGIDDTQNLQIGRALVVLGPDAVYPIKVGENLLDIALNKNTSINSIYRNNPWLNGKQNATSDGILTISYPNEKLGKISTNACAYPDINKDVLAKTLPYLTYLTIMGAEVAADGTLEPIDDAQVIETSRYYGTSPIMHINLRNNRVLKNESRREELIKETENILISKRYDGVGIDFGEILPEALQHCSDFFVKLKDTCNNRGKVVFADSRCDKPVSDITKSADGIIMLPETTVGLPCQFNDNNRLNTYMPIRGFATDMITSDSGADVNMTILSDFAALTIAGDTDSQIVYDDNNTSEAYFEYTDAANRRHKVLFDDPRGIYTTLKHALENGYPGITVWNIDKFCPYLWSVINTNVDIVRTGDKELKNKHFPLT